jgi:zinc transporter, ZIP family
VPDLLMKVTLYTLSPVAATIIGGTIAAFRTPGDKVRSAIQHFAAGVVFAAIAVELLPDIVHQRAPVPAVLGFALGVALMFAIKWLTEKREAKEASKTPIGLIATVGIDMLIDGFLIGIGFAAGAKAGLLITVALTLELLSLGLAVSAELGQAGIARNKSLLWVAGLAVLPMLGAMLGATLFGGVKGAVLEAALSFGCAALLYLVTEELLVEAHEVPDSPAITATFFIGFLLLLVLDMVS